MHSRLLGPSGARNANLLPLTRDIIRCRRSAGLLFKGLGKGERRPHVVLGTIYEDIRGKSACCAVNVGQDCLSGLSWLWESFWFIAYEI